MLSADKPHLSALPVRQAGFGIFPLPRRGKNLLCKKCVYNI